MDDQLFRIWDQLIGRLEGPLFLRFILQPTVAAILALRAGIADARANRQPYLWTVASRPAERDQLIHEGWQNVSKVFLVATILDGVYQLVVFRWLYPVQAVLVAFVLAVVPYIIVRGPATRVARRFIGSQQMEKV